MKSQLDWEQIGKEIKHAVNASTKSQYVATRKIAEHIMEHQGSYPSFQDPSLKKVIARITMSCNKQGWGLWSSSRQTGRQKVYAVPWREHA